MEETPNINKKEIQAPIRKVLSLDGCPLCLLLRQDEFDCLCEWASYTSDNNENLRTRLGASSGFCNHHFWRFQKVSGDYGCAKLGADLIEKTIRLLKNSEIALASYGKRKSNDAVCPLCFDLKAKEQTYLKEMTIALKEREEDRKQYAKGCGFCIPHFAEVLSYINESSLRDFLFESQLVQLERIKDHARKLFSKRYGPLRWGQTEEEKRAGLMAVAKLVGERVLNWE